MVYAISGMLSTIAGFILISRLNSAQPTLGTGFELDAIAAVVGFDANDDAVAAVKSGEMEATVAQKPALIGSLAIEATDNIIKGKPVEKQVNVELALVTK